MTIQKNLRELRKAAGMTQEEAANQVGLTRQAISSYESGRTRPDIDMLMKLAQVYGTDISCILYGKSAAQTESQTLQKWRQIVKILAIVFMAILLVLFLADSIVLLVANTRCKTPYGSFFTPRGDIYFSLFRIWDLLRSIAGTLASLFCLFLAGALLPLKQPPSQKKCLLYFCFYYCISLLFTIPFAFFDPRYGIFSYRLIVWMTLPNALLLLLYCLVLGAVKKWPQRKAAKEAKEETVL